MISKTPNDQEPNANHPDGFVTSSNEKTGRPPHMQPRWKLAGIDAEGAHHVLQDDDDIIYVIQNGEVEAKEELGDWRANKTITAWHNFVEDKRGWDVFFLQIVDLTNGILGGTHR